MSEWGRTSVHHSFFATSKTPSEAPKCIQFEFYLAPIHLLKKVETLWWLLFWWKNINSACQHLMSAQFFFFWFLIFESCELSSTVYRFISCLFLYEKQIRLWEGPCIVRFQKVWSSEKNSIWFYLPDGGSQLKGSTILSRYCFYLVGAVIVTSSGDVIITAPTK